MIMSCLGSAAMQNVDESNGASGDSSLARKGRLSNPAVRGRQSTAVLSDQESTDESERLRRDSTSVKSTSAFQFWSSYVGECGSNSHGKRDSTSPHSVDPESNGPGSNGMAPPQANNLNSIFNRSVDLACFSVNQSLSEDNQGEGAGAEPSASVTPRVSCSIEVTGRRSISRTFNVKPTFRRCAPSTASQGDGGTAVPNQDTLDSMDMRDNEGLATDPSQDSEGAYGLTPDPTLSIVSSGFEDGLTPDPTVSIQSSYVPASYSNLVVTNPSTALHKERILPALAYPRKETMHGTVNESSVQCHPDESPTFTHYSLLIGKGSVDSDDLFAALSSSTKSGVSVRDLQLPVSSLSATTFLSSPSATTVEGSDALAIDVAASTAAVEAPFPTSTKSTFSTVISSMSSFSIDEPTSTSNKAHAFSRSSKAPISLRTNESKSLHSNEPANTSLAADAFRRTSKESASLCTSESKWLQRDSSTAAATDPTPKASEPNPTTQTGRKSVSKNGVMNTTNDSSWIRKESEMVSAEGEGKAKKTPMLENCGTELTAPETLSSSQTMDESLQTGSQITDPIERDVMLTAGIQGATKPPDVQTADPYEWAYDVWRAKGLISDRNAAVKCISSSLEAKARPRKTGGDTSVRPSETTMQKKVDTTEHTQVLCSARSAAPKVDDPAKHQAFSSILQRWREKSDERQVADHTTAPTAAARENTNAEDVENQGNDDELQEVWESNEASGTTEKMSHTTRDVWSPFVPRPPSPKSKRLSASSGLRRTPSPRHSPRNRSSSSPQVSSPLTVKPNPSNERSPFPPSSSGHNTASLLIKEAKVVRSQATTVVDKVEIQQSPAVKKVNTSPSRRRITDDNSQINTLMAPTSQASKIISGKGDEWGILVSATQNARRSVHLPKSNSDYKAAVRSFLHAVESNDLDRLKSYTKQSEGDKVTSVAQEQVHRNTSSGDEPTKPWIKDRRKPWHRSHLESFDARASLPFHGETARRSKVEQPERTSNIRACTLTSGGSTSMIDDPLVSDLPCHLNEVRDVEKSLQQGHLQGVTQETPLKHQSLVSGSEVKSLRRTGSKCSPASTFRSPSTRVRESTRLSPGEPLIGKTIKVPSSVKRKPDNSLNETAESGTWVRLLNLESAGADDSVEYEGIDQMRSDGTGGTDDSHPWRRDMVVRKVNSFEGDFSVRTSLFEESCVCASSAFSGKDELVEFYLPKMGMACNCGARRSDSQLRNPEEPTSLENILRPWQTEFLASFGIYRGDQLVKAYHRSGPALAKAMRRYRKKHGMTSFQTKCCGMALGIWTKTSKAFVRSIRKQITTGVVPNGIKVPNTLYILTSFLDKIPTEGGAVPYIEGFGSIRSSIPSEECSL